MHLLLISPTFFPVRGGTEQVVAEIAQRLAQRHTVTLMTPWIRKGQYDRYEQELGIRIVRVPSINTTGLNVLIPQLFLFFMLPGFFLWQKIRGRKISVHMFHIYNLGGVVALWKKVLGFPLVISLTGWDTYDPVKPLPRWTWPYLAWVMNSADTVTTMCTHMKENARKQGCRKEVEIIPHGTTLPEKRVKKGFDIRKKWGMGKNEKIVFSLQRLFPRKGMEYLMRAVPKVIAKYPAVKFVIGGKGPEREKLETLAQEGGAEKNIIFAGFIPDDELKNYYAAAQVFALPSLYEGFGVVYVDALSCGVPVVTTRCGGPEDFIDFTTRENGILVPVRDEDALARAITTALEKKWDRQKIMKSAQAYDWNAILNRYVECYKKRKKE